MFDRVLGRLGVVGGRPRDDGGQGRSPAVEREHECEHEHEHGGGYGDGSYS